MRIDRAFDAARRIQAARPAIISILFWSSLIALKPAYGQETFSVNIRLSSELLNAQILRISDFNVTGSGSISQLFTLEIDNNGGPIQSRLRFECFSDQFPGTPIVEVTTQSFPISSGPNTFTYDNFRSAGVHYNSEALQGLTDQILQTGRLPNGSYTFVITLLDVRQSNGQVPSDTETITISNPTTLDLISPGAAVGRGECMMQFGLLPQFKWQSDASRFLITVCEALPSNSSPEDVMQNQPRLQMELVRDRDFFGSPTFLYPSGGLPLEYGKTYYWQIHAIISSPSGEIRLPSEIWCFQISSLTNPSGDMLFKQLLNLLASLLGASEAEALFAEGGQFHGFSPTGELRLNGQRMNLSDLLNQLRNQSVRAVSVQVE